MKNKYFDTNTESQRQRLLARLRHAPITTLEARHELDILGVAPRVFELRHLFGYNIQTYWIDGKNPGGGRHKVAKYVLFSGVWKGGKQ